MMMMMMIMVIIIIIIIIIKVFTHRLADVTMMIAEHSTQRVNSLMMIRTR